MVATRRDVLRDAAARDAFIRGVRLLKQELPAVTTADLGIAGDALPLSTYDLFVAWHYFAMYTFTPASQSDRNAAHLGPVFLPWHRFFLLLFELHLQRVLEDPEFGLPYWDWAADGELEMAAQARTPLWADDSMGGDGTPVESGPFAVTNGWSVRLDTDRDGLLRSTDRGLRRAFQRGLGLPTRSEVDTALQIDIYDDEPWNSQSQGFRNALEGWGSGEPRLHNRVHVWVGGDMGVATSPNDPVFYLNHVNVDRLWALWQERHPSAVYVPDDTAPEELRGHCIGDPMHALLSPPVTPRDVLDHRASYLYA